MSTTQSTLALHSPGAHCCTLAVCALQNIYGTIKPLPDFARQQVAQQPADASMQHAASQGPPASLEAWEGPQVSSEGTGPFLVAWDLQADQGMAQVLLLARSAHCLQRLHAMGLAARHLASTSEWQV